MHMQILIVFMRPHRMVCPCSVHSENSNRNLLIANEYKPGVQEDQREDLWVRFTPVAWKERFNTNIKVCFYISEGFLLLERPKSVLYHMITMTKMRLP